MLLVWGACLPFPGQKIGKLAVTDHALTVLGQRSIVICGSITVCLYIQPLACHMEFAPPPPPSIISSSKILFSSSLTADSKEISVQPDNQLLWNSHTQGKKGPAPL